MNSKSVVFQMLAAVGLLFLGPSLEAAKGKYDVKFGLMSAPSGGVPYVYDEARVIERVGDGLTDAHGFTISRKGGGRFMYHYRITFPEPMELPAGFVQKGRQSADKKTFTLDSVMQWDIAFQVFFFSADDPLGTYKMEIFIDDESYLNAEYEVTKVGAAFDGLEGF